MSFPKEPTVGSEGLPPLPPPSSSTTMPLRSMARPSSSSHLTLLHSPRTLTTTAAGGVPSLAEKFTLEHRRLSQQALFASLQQQQSGSRQSSTYRGGETEEESCVLAVLPLDEPSTSAAARSSLPCDGVDEGLTFSSPNAAGATCSGIEEGCSSSSAAAVSSSSALSLQRQRRSSSRSAGSEDDERKGSSSAASSTSHRTLNPPQPLSVLQQQQQQGPLGAPSARPRPPPLIFPSTSASTVAPAPAVVPPRLFRIASLDTSSSLLPAVSSSSGQSSQIHSRTRRDRGGSTSAGSDDPSATAATDVPATTTIAAEVLPPPILSPRPLIDKPPFTDPLIQLASNTELRIASGVSRKFFVKHGSAGFEWSALKRVTAIPFTSNDGLSDAWMYHVILEMDTAKQSSLSSPLAVSPQSPRSAFKAASGTAQSPRLGAESLNMNNNNNNGQNRNIRTNAQHDSNLSESAPLQSTTADNSASSPSLWNRLFSKSNSGKNAAKGGVGGKNKRESSLSDDVRSYGGTASVARTGPSTAINHADDSLDNVDLFGGGGDASSTSYQRPPQAPTQHGRTASSASPSPQQQQQSPFGSLRTLPPLPNSVSPSVSWRSPQGMYLPSSRSRKSHATPQQNKTGGLFFSSSSAHHHQNEAAAADPSRTAQRHVRPTATTFPLPPPFLVAKHYDTSEMQPAPFSLRLARHLTSTTAEKMIQHELFFYLHLAEFFGYPESPFRVPRCFAAAQKDRGEPGFCRYVCCGEGSGTVTTIIMEDMQRCGFHFEHASGGGLYDESSIHAVLIAMAYLHSSLYKRCDEEALKGLEPATILLFVHRGSPALRNIRSKHEFARISLRNVFRKWIDYPATWFLKHSCVQKTVSFLQAKWDVIRTEALDIVTRRETVVHGDVHYKNVGLRSKFGPSHHPARQSQHRAAATAGPGAGGGSGAEGVGMIHRFLSSDAILFASASNQGSLTDPSAPTAADGCDTEHIATTVASPVAIRSAEVCETQACFLDFQSCGPGSMAAEVLYFLCTSIPVDVDLDSHGLSMISATEGSAPPPTALSGGAGGAGGRSSMSSPPQHAEEMSVNIFVSASTVPPLLASTDQYYMSESINNNGPLTGDDLRNSSEGILSSVTTTTGGAGGGGFGGPGPMSSPKSDGTEEHSGGSLRSSSARHHSLPPAAATTTGTRKEGSPSEMGSPTPHRQAAGLLQPSNSPIHVGGEGGSGSGGTGGTTKSSTSQGMAAVFGSLLSRRQRANTTHVPTSKRGGDVGVSSGQSQHESTGSDFPRTEPAHTSPSLKPRAGSTRSPPPPIAVPGTRTSPPPQTAAEDALLAARGAAAIGRGSKMTLAELLSFDVMLISTYHENLDPQVRLEYTQDQFIHDVYVLARHWAGCLVFDLNNGTQQERAALRTDPQLKKLLDWGEKTAMRIFVMCASVYTQIDAANHV